MKLVIQTTIHTNISEDKDMEYWKADGGNTYVVRNLTTAHIEKIAEDGLPVLTALIEHEDSVYREEILDWDILDDSQLECHDMDMPIDLTYIHGRWLAGQHSSPNLWRRGDSNVMVTWNLGESKYDRNYRLMRWTLKPQKTIIEEIEKI